MTVRPETDGDVSIALPAERSCGVSGPRESGAICTKSRPRRRLTNAPAATVPGPASASAPAPLTASFEGVPEGHDGQSLFRFRVAFSEDIGIGLRSLREGAFTVSGGRVTGGRRVDGRRDLFEMTVRPDSVGEVSIALAAGRACAVSGAICTRSEPRRPAQQRRHGQGVRPRGRAVDGGVRGRAGGARRRERVQVPDRVQRPDQVPGLDVAVLRRGGGWGPGVGGAAGRQSQGPVGAHGAAENVRGHRAHARAGGGLRQAGSGVHAGRAGAVEHGDRDGGGTGGGVGSGRAGPRKARTRPSTSR